MIGSAYITVVLGIIVAKGIGFYRDMLFAGVFGTSVWSDIYFQIFGLVNLIFTGIGVALSTLVIKNLNKSENLGKEKNYAAAFLRKSALYMTIVAVLVCLAAKPIISIILPEISGQDLDLAVKMMYAMAPSLIFVVIAYIISGLLQNKKAYFITSIMSLPFNAVIIASLMIKGVSVFTVGLVTTLGWFLHIVVQLPAFFKNGYSFTARSEKSKSDISKSTEIIWIFISNMMFQLCVYIDRAFVSSSEGMASTFNYASNLFITIASIFVVAMSTVVFPSISKNYEEGNILYVKKLVGYIIKIMTAIFLPFLLVAICFGDEVVRLLYERGAFSSESTARVSFMFLLYTLGALGYVAQELFNKVLYLAGKYKYTVIGTVSVVVVNVISNFTIKKLVPDDIIVSGLPLSTVLVAASTSVLLIVYAFAVSVGMIRLLGNFFTKAVVKDILKIVICAVLAFAAYIVCEIFIPEITHGYISFVVPLVICAVVYVASLLVTGEVKALLKMEKGEE